MRSVSIPGTVSILVRCLQPFVRPEIPATPARRPEPHGTRTRAVNALVGALSYGDCPGSVPGL